MGHRESSNRKLRDRIVDADWILSDEAERLAETDDVLCEVQSAYGTRWRWEGLARWRLEHVLNLIDAHRAKESSVSTEQAEQERIDAATRAEEERVVKNDAEAQALVEGLSQALRAGPHGALVVGSEAGRVPANAILVRLGFKTKARFPRRADRSFNAEGAVALANRLVWDLQAEEERRQELAERRRQDLEAVEKAIPESLRADFHVARGPDGYSGHTMIRFEALTAEEARELAEELAALRARHPKVS